MREKADKKTAIIVVECKADNLTSKRPAPQKHGERQNDIKLLTCLYPLN